MPTCVVEDLGKVVRSEVEVKVQRGTVLPLFTALWSCCKFADY